MIQFSTPEIAAAAAQLGVTAVEIQGCGQYPTPEECREKLAELQARVKKSYKRCALELHPDRTGGDPEKAALFADVAKLWAIIEKMEIIVRPPQRPPVMIVMTPGGGIHVSGSGSGTSTNTTTSWGGWQTWSPTR